LKHKKKIQGNILQAKAQINQKSGDPGKNQNPEKLFLGTNAKFNNYISQSPEQKEFPFYLVDTNGNIHCHSGGHLLAVFTEKSQRKCAKLYRTTRKCCLFISNIQESHYLFIRT
jgi:hypothetical protein